MAKDGQERRQAAILDEAERAAGKPLTVRELMQRAKLHPGERTEVKRALRDLVSDGRLLRDGKRYGVPGKRAAPAGPGRLAPAAPGRRRAVGDGELLGTLKKHRGGRTMGRIREVVERRRRLVIGTYHARGPRSFVLPVDAELAEAVPVPETSLAEDGDVVKVALEPGTRDLAGSVVEKIGRPGEPRVEVLRVAYARGFADVFPPEVLAAAETTPDHVRAEDRAGRRDLTALPLVTIDGEDARDFDDAVHVERLEPSRGHARWRLVVAIADVAHYVRPGEPLDDEANRRATSVYFPMQVLPMLPERLSNGICSLNPDVDRLCMVADMVIGSAGETVSAEVYQGVMRSAARCTYTEVARVLDGETLPARERFRPQFEIMAELQAKLSTMRRGRGSIDFDLPEAKILLDEAGNVAAIEKRPRNQAHRIVEEFMLAANEAVARWFGARDLPTIYRVHGLPDEDKLRAFLELAESHGFEVPETPADPRALNALLGKFKGHAQQRALNQLLLRAMMQAVYSPENIGHYGLAAEHYLHFTSPIRRYPDLIVHRLLKEEWTLRQDGGAGRRTPLPALEEKAVISSERERASMEAEREIAAFYAALFMKDKVGETFEGVVSAVVEFGFFVELRPWFVEGLVKAEDLGAALELDPVQHALVDVTTGRTFRVGDEVKVEVANVSTERRRIDLRLIALAGEKERGAAAPERTRPGAARTRPAAIAKDARSAGAREPAPASGRGRGRALADAVSAARRSTGGGGDGRGGSRAAAKKGGARSEAAGKGGRGRAEGRPQGRTGGGFSVELVAGGQATGRARAASRAAVKDRGAAKGGRPAKKGAGPRPRPGAGGGRKPGRGGRSR
jgi:ribonuclease R